ncbi:hypothetical protein Q1695_007035 [Nippostrongylus brasiliensis]|nr:hypothetical protein Q1695_007035 [Nippostrongylus brasiliensis]
MMRSVLQLFSTFSWNRVAIYYSPNEVQYCDGIIDDALTAFSDESTYYVEVVQKVVWDRVDNKYLSDQLQRTKNLARIVVLCMDTGKDRRTFAKRAHALDMASEEYVYVLLGTRGFGFGQSMGGGLKELSNGLTPFWEDLLNNHTDDAVVKEVARRMLTVDINIEGVSADALKEFSRNVVPRVRRDPLFCSTEACLTNDGKPMSVWARHLHDVFYLYGLSLNQSLAIDPIGGQSNATVLNQSMQRTFLGLTGLVTIDENGTRVPLFTVYGLDDNYNQIAFINFTLHDGTPVMSKSYTDEATTIWQTRGGERPLARPLCGYSGRDCPKAFWELYTIYVAVGAALIGATLVAVVTILVVLIRIRRAERQRERMLWQVPHLQLRRPPSLRAEQSKPSLQSGRSAVTGDSRFTSEAKFGRYEIYILGKDPVLTSKYPPSILTENDYSRFSQMSKLHHDNVNRFVGLSIDGAQYVAVWRMCTRGTLQGMRFLHTSTIGSHGRLRSGCCMVTENWQVKISDYGTESLLEEDRAKRKRLLWTAPEHLRAGERSSQASKEGDIFSFAIISSEIVTRRGAWNLHERKEQMDELLYMIRKGGADPLRPELSTEADISPALLHLIRDCWAEKPSDRPSADTVCTTLRTMTTNKKANLMDHMFNMLEDYTTSLELNVEERTKELQEEKKKADILLGRMLPRQVADRLKLGQAIEPENFDSVTIFFSDVVKFTQLAAKCTAFQAGSSLRREMDEEGSAKRWKHLLLQMEG